MLDGLLAAEQLPEEYQDRYQVSYSPIPGSLFRACIYHYIDCPRIYYVTTVREKADHGSIGSTTNVAYVVRTTPGSSRPTR